MLKCLASLATEMRAICCCAATLVVPCRFHCTLLGPISKNVGYDVRPSSRFLLNTAAYEILVDRGTGRNTCLITALDQPSQDFSPSSLITNCLQLCYDDTFFDPDLTIPLAAMSRM
jgi:hypothetical protein